MEVSEATTTQRSAGGRLEMVVTMPRRLEGSYCSKPLEDGTADWTLAVVVRGRFQKSLKTANARDEGEEEDEAGS